MDFIITVLGLLLLIGLAISIIALPVMVVYFFIDMMITIIEDMED